MKFKFTKETAKRMLKTFVQTAAGYIIVNIAGVDFTGDRAVSYPHLKLPTIRLV